MVSRLSYFQGLDAKRRGERAETRLSEIFKRLHLHFERSRTLDYSQKTDLMLLGVLRLQVSVARKSEVQRKILLDRGVYSIVAGPQVTDEYIVYQVVISIIDYLQNREYKQELVDCLLQIYVCSNSTLVSDKIKNYIDNFFQP